MDLLSGSNWCVQGQMTQGQMTFDLSLLNVRHYAIIIHILILPGEICISLQSMDPFQLSTLDSSILANHVQKIKVLFQHWPT